MPHLWCLILLHQVVREADILASQVPAYLTIVPDKHIAIVLSKEETVDRGHLRPAANMIYHMLRQFPIYPVLKPSKVVPVHAERKTIRTPVQPVFIDKFHKTRVLGFEVAAPVCF